MTLGLRWSPARVAPVATNRSTSSSRVRSVGREVQVEAMTTGSWFVRVSPQRDAGANAAQEQGQTLPHWHSDRGSLPYASSRGGSAG